MKVCVLIPVHNEAKAIGRVVSALRQKGLDAVVIDDGSSDGSGTIAQKEGATVISTLKRSGKGGALQKGFEYLLNKDYEGLILMDGDGQHAISDIDAFLNEYKASGCEVIVGNRMHNAKGMPLIRRLTNRFMSWLISLVCGQIVPDTQCGYRWIKMDVLRTIRFTVFDFEIETEILIQSSRKGFRIVSVPVQTIYDGEDSKIRPLLDTWRFTRYILREIFRGKS